MKEHRQSGEKMQKEITKLSVKKMNLETDLENANHQIDILDKEIAERETHLKEAKQIIHRYFIPLSHSIMIVPIVNVWCSIVVE